MQISAEAERCTIGWTLTVRLKNIRLEEYERLLKMKRMQMIELSLKKLLLCVLAVMCISTLGYYVLSSVCAWIL